MVEKKAMAKVVLLGEMGVGKTTLLNSFMGNQGVSKATVGNDFKKKDLRVENTIVTLQVWDTAGQE